MIEYIKKNYDFVDAIKTDTGKISYQLADKFNKPVVELDE